MIGIFPYWCQLKNLKDILWSIKTVEWASHAYELDIQPSHIKNPNLKERTLTIQSINQNLLSLVFVLATCSWLYIYLHFFSPPQLHPSFCARTVLLTEIPDVLEREMMCEALEIHFQKPSKGGGEVETAVYIPAGHYAVAVFEEED